MSGTIRFDDEHIVKFTLDTENEVITLEIIVEDTTYNKIVPLGEIPGELG